MILLPTKNDVDRCKKYIKNKYPQYENTTVIDFEYFKKLVLLLNRDEAINQKIVM